jgi:hypothetical protein
MKGYIQQKSKYPTFCIALMLVTTTFSSASGATWKYDERRWAFKHWILEAVKTPYLLDLCKPSGIVSVHNEVYLLHCNQHEWSVDYEIV